MKIPFKLAVVLLEIAEHVEYKREPTEAITTKAIIAWVELNSLLRDEVQWEEILEQYQEADDVLMYDTERIWADMEYMITELKKARGDEQANSDT